ncbi:4-(cytidine 5'-diphospho)-2-C-methyl-D-erythritol kinase [Virgibacillus xinjiangensis]|uniref:4-diphosphocytidyl-2-C-methyl-D-erythritol kinase n=1 Tax=Virgibacillus xinjiangensis TaxID=393090 RepID=A0ABV7CWY0_9BACI
MTLFEKAPAKINLSLDVLDKRDDGYHNVEMIMTTVDLADRVELRPMEMDRVKVALESRYVPSDERNLAYRAAALFKKEYGIKKGVHIQVEKCIPVAAGLGGGSTDAAAVLRGLNRMWKLGIPIGELSDLGAELGSDVPFCVHGHTALAKGKGEIIERLNPPPSCWVVLAKPNIGVSTKTIFQRVKPGKLPHPETALLLSALEDGNFNDMCSHLGNSLEDITFSVYPEVERIKEKMKQAGAEGVLMSGSGPTVYGLVQQESKAQRIYNSMQGFCHEVHLVRLLG